MVMKQGEHYIKRPRFDNVLSTGHIIQLVVIITGLFTGGVTLYNQQIFQAQAAAKKLDELTASVKDLTMATTISLGKLDDRIRVVEVDLPRQSDRIGRLKEDVDRLDRLVSTNYPKNPD